MRHILGASFWLENDVGRVADCKWFVLFCSVISMLAISVVWYAFGKCLELHYGWRTMMNTSIAHVYRFWGLKGCGTPNSV